jgi:hypothetical protein
MSLFVTHSINDIQHSYAEYHYAECHYAECHYAECHYAECHYAESRYPGCRSAYFPPQLTLVVGCV